MTGIYWAIAIVVLQAVVAALAKRAQENAKAAKSAGGASSSPKPEPRVVAKGRPSRSAQPPQSSKSPNPRVGSTAASRSSKPTAAPQPKGGVFQQTSQRQQIALGRDVDSAAASASRQHLTEAVAKLRAMEAKVADASGIHAVHPGVGARSAASAESRRLAADMRRALLSPKELRRAFLLGEILGRPKSAQST